MVGTRLWVEGHVGRRDSLPGEGGRRREGKPRADGASAGSHPTFRFLRGTCLPRALPFDRGTTCDGRLKCTISPPESSSRKQRAGAVALGFGGKRWARWN